MTDKKPVTTTVCAIMKDEGPYILEWLAYHKVIGFDTVVIYDNETHDGSENLFRALAQLGEIKYVAWPDRPGASPQTTAYTDAMKHIKTDWVCFIDTDEFINLHNHDKVQDFLGSFAPEVSAIALNWRLFGSSNLLTMGPGLVMERFTRAAKPEFHVNMHIKTIARFADMERMHIHRCDLKSGLYVNVSGKPIEIIRMGFSPSVDFSVAQLNHYVVKSKEEFVLKKMRGNVNRAPDSIEKFKKVNDQFFDHHDKNDETDVSILRFRSKVLAELGRLLAALDRAGIQPRPSEIPTYSP